MAGKSMRLKLAFIMAAVLNAWKTVLGGTLPLTLANSIAAALNRLVRYGKVEQRNLPQGFTELSYIESSGTQYILTPVKDVRNGTFYLDFAMTETPSSGFPTIWGAMPASGDYKVVFASGTNKLYNQLGNASGSVSTIDKDLNWHEVTVTTTDDNVSVDIDGEVFSASYTITEDTTYALSLFARNRYDGMSNFAKLKLRRAWHKNAQGEYDFYGIPVQDTVTNECGIYDLISGSLLGNEGTGDFVAGPVATPTPDRPMDLWCNNGRLTARHQSGLPLGYQKLDYIEGTGAQYLDTGFFFDNIATDTLTIDFIKTVATDSGAGTVFYGCRDAYKVNGYGMQFQDTGATYIQWSDKDTGLGSSPAMQIGTRYTTVRIGPYYSVGGSEYTITDAVTPVQTYPLFLFGMNSGGSISSASAAKIYEVTVVNAQGVTKMHLLPAKRLSDNALGMYDLVRGVFLTNQGTGDFVAGSTVSDPIGVYADGTPETLVVSNNRFNPTEEYAVNVGKFINSSGAWAGSPGNDFLTLITKLDEGKEYTVERTTTGIGNCALRITAFDSSIPSSASGRSSVIYIGTVSDTSYTFTVPTGFPYVAVYVRHSSGTASDEAVISGFKVYQGVYGEQTASVPTLLAVGDYKDSAELISGIKTGRVGGLVLDGVTDGRKFADFTTESGYNRATVTIGDKRNDSSDPVLCTHFEKANVARVNTCSSTTNRAVTFRFAFETLEAANGFLADQYAADTPVIVLYPLDEETTEQSRPQSLNSYSGTTVVDTECEVEPVDAEVVYKGRN